MAAVRIVGDIKVARVVVALGFVGDDCFFVDAVALDIRVYIRVGSQSFRNAVFNGSSVVLYVKYADVDACNLCKIHDHGDIVARGKARKRTCFVGCAVLDDMSSTLIIYISCFCSRDNKVQVTVAVIKRLDVRDNILAVLLY